MLPIQMQAIIVEQNKLFLDKFQIFNKPNSSLSYSGANSKSNSIDGGGVGVNESNANLQIPTISTLITK